MSQVYLLRHAKAVWPSPGQKDFDRTLDTAGIEAARILGQELRRSGLKPEIVVCSTAIRARQTLEYLELEPPFVLDQSEKLFSGGPDAYLMAIRMAGLEHETANSVMLVGHNPMMEELAIALAGRGQPPSHPDFESGFPTAGLAVIRFDAPLAEVRPGTGELQAFFTPSAHH
ncbi:histidine phosphatase [Phyllobacterium brassicacearum]|uniref:Histidine phosphatase n=1 Tax=Phyllobacterium brassicacearum TaxID=314235 RepID=A0A2P7BTA8_9HYPH|nr:histidine phosphatase family protein [Phyllobacterium brassicacearum]PSH69719.1 histidine phosphatase [Phyllobacterium brassicacearum]TDQ34860.1 phosphohistidine phosphatase [Phyllobacterium brassicacearum]